VRRYQACICRRGDGDQGLKVLDFYPGGGAALLLGFSGQAEEAPDARALLAFWIASGDLEARCAHGFPPVLHEAVGGTVYELFGQVNGKTVQILDAFERSFKPGINKAGAMKIAKQITLALGLILIPGAALAASSKQQSSFSYAFAEYDHYSATGGTLDGGGGGGGWRINRYLGIEGGGQYSRKYGVDITNLYAQALLILPLGKQFSVDASIGGAYGTASASARGFTVSKSSSGYRAGVGMEYWFAQHWALRAEVHRQNVVGVADDFGAGIAYRF
jgi:hypothetical protein